MNASLRDRVLASFALDPTDEKIFQPTESSEVLLGELAALTDGGRLLAEIRDLAVLAFFLDKKGSSQTAEWLLSRLDVHSVRLRAFGREGRRVADSVETQSKQQRAARLAIGEPTQKHVPLDQKKAPTNTTSATPMARFSLKAPGEQ